MHVAAVEEKKADERARAKDQERGIDREGGAGQFSKADAGGPAHRITLRMTFEIISMNNTTMTIEMTTRAAPA